MQQFTNGLRRLIVAALIYSVYFSLQHILEASQAVTQVPHLQFSAHAVGPRHQDRVYEAGSLQVKEPRETSKFCVTAWQESKTTARFTAAFLMKGRMRCIICLSGYKNVFKQVIFAQFD